MNAEETNVDGWKLTDLEPLKFKRRKIVHEELENPVVLHLAKILDGEKDQEGKDAALYDILKSIHNLVDTDAFDTACDLVKFRCTPARPRFFKEGASFVVADVPPVPEAEKEAFATKYIDDSYIHDYSSPEAQERVGEGIQQIRELQYKRWDWCNSNFPTFVNMLRLSGHSDDNIQSMVNGRPLCLADDDLLKELQTSLKDLKPKIEAATHLTHVGFVFTGSSVTGFSQNPMKGQRFTPTKITSTGKSDVDISIKANGVDIMIDELREKGVRTKSYPTTCSLRSGGIRHGIKGDLGKTVCQALADWYNEWAAKLPGGLQITFCEDGLKIPPWEARINILDEDNSERENRKRKR